MNAHAELDHRAALDGDLAHLAAHKDAWAHTSVAERIAILKDIRGRVVDVAEGWAETAARKKLLPEGSPLAAEEWMSGPYALLMACDALLETLRGMEGRAYLRGLPRRYLPNGQLALGVVPASVWDKLLLNGISAEVWMEAGVSEANLAEVTAPAYAVPEADRMGKVALVLGAGNIASIPPLDCLQKLFQEHQVVLLKMNPVNDYLTDYFRAALRPLIDIGALRIVEGDGAVGAYLTDHPLVEQIHITGAGATHDAIVWGAGEEGARNKAAGTPKNTRRITSELGAVCPTIVVPGPWSREDIAYQAENLATQKLHNSGFNCIACQVLVLPKDWDQKDALLAATKKVISKNTRLAYYPGAEDRLADFGSGDVVERGDAPGLVVSPETTATQAESEVFGPAMSLHEIAGEGEAYLREAIAYANATLHGTLGAGILIHPETLRAIGKRRFDELISELCYGCIGVNVWSGAGFLLPQVPWGAFPGHTLEDVQSGIGTVHNALMFSRSERTIVRGPWAPFPRSLKYERTLLPRPPWFVTHRHAHKVLRGLTAFMGDKKLWRLPGIFLNAMRG